MLNNNSLFNKQEIKTQVSIVLNIIDDFSGGKPQGNIRLILQDENFNIVNVNAIKNLSGFYVFTDLEPGKYNVIVLSENYLDAQNEVITMEDKQQKNINSVDIHLKPNSRYPFLNNTTLIRGTVYDKNGAGINKALVTIEEMNFTAYTDEKGQFLVYFNDFSSFVDDKGIYIMDVIINFELVSAKLSRSVRAMYGKTIFCEVTAI